MASLSTTMTAAVERGMRLASVEFACDVIRQLKEEGVLTCSADDAMKLFDFEAVSIVSSRSKASKKRESAKSRGEKKSAKAKITEKPSVVLPFCGVIVNDWCAGVKFNHGLHTQCTQGRCKGDRYCKTCRKHADNSATGKPPYGDIEDRANYGVDYRDPKGKLTVPYANVAEKMGISIDAAHTAAANMGWEIPAEQLVKRVAKRGRPAKSAAVSDTDSEDGESKTSTKKKRGRPTKPKAKATTQEDQIAMLVAEAYAETASTTTAKKAKKAKKPKMTAEEKAAAKLAKKEAADKLKAEKKAAKEAEKAAAKLQKEQDKAAAKLAKQEAAAKLKAEKKAAKEAEKAAKKEAAAKLKADKLAAKKLEKEQKAAAKQAAKAEKLAAAKAKAAAKKAKAAKKPKTAAVVAEVKPAVEEKTAVEDAVVEADLFLGTDDVAAVLKGASDAQQSVMQKNDELDFEEIDEEADSSDEAEDEGLELSETMTVGGVEYFFTEQDGQTILFTKNGEPVGIYDADTDTVQECEFDEE
jgi:colicin import membrane protein